jgi:hypothetical protein
MIGRDEATLDTMHRIFCLMRVQPDTQECTGIAHEAEDVIGLRRGRDPRQPSWGWSRQGHALRWGGRGLAGIVARGEPEG